MEQVDDRPAKMPSLTRYKVTSSIIGGHHLK